MLAVVKGAMQVFTEYDRFEPREGEPCRMSARCCTCVFCVCFARALCDQGLGRSVCAIATTSRDCFGRLISSVRSSLSVHQPSNMQQY